MTKIAQWAKDAKRALQIGEVDSHRLVLLPSHALVVFGMSATSMFLPPINYPTGPCTQIVYTLAIMYLNRNYVKAKDSTIWVHGPSGYKLSTLQPEIPQAAS